MDNANFSLKLSITTQIKICITGNKGQPIARGSRQCEVW